MLKYSFVCHSKSVFCCFMHHYIISKFDQDRNNYWMIRLHAFKGSLERACQVRVFTCKIDVSP